MYLIINDNLKQNIIDFEEHLSFREEFDEEQHIVLELTVFLGSLNKNEHVTSQLLKDFSFGLIEDSIFKVSIYDDEDQLIYESTEYTSILQASLGSHLDNGVTGNLSFKKILC